MEKKKSRNYQGGKKRDTPAASVSGAIGMSASANKTGKEKRGDGAKAQLAEKGRKRAAGDIGARTVQLNLIPKKTHLHRS